jgi:HNH endonuclease
MIFKNIKERFLSYVNVPHDCDACWPWLGYIDENGYGRFSLDGKAVRVHQASYILFVGPIPAGKEPDHTCRHRWCANPSHLEAVTHRVNVLRGTGATARNARKERCIKGHLLSGDNISVGGHGRVCITCRRSRGRNLYNRRRSMDVCFRCKSPSNGKTFCPFCAKNISETRPSRARSAQR